MKRERRQTMSIKLELVGAQILKIRKILGGLTNLRTTLKKQETKSDPPLTFFILARSELNVAKTDETFA